MTWRMNEALSNINDKHLAVPEMCLNFSGFFWKKTVATLKALSSAENIFWMEKMSS